MFFIDFTSYILPRYILKPLHLQTWSHAPISSRVPIAPGLFKGEYNELGSKCTELIVLSYQEDSNSVTFTGRKVTGDTHLPAGKRSFQGSLNDCLKMKLDEQVGLISEVFLSRLPL